MFVLLAVVCFGSHAIAQGTVPPLPMETKPVVTAQEKAPAISEVTKLKLEVAALKQQLALVNGQLQVCTAQSAPETYKATMTTIGQDVAKVIADFEKANPGWTLDTSTMQPKKKGGD
jgi:hypothetical protein